MRYCTSKLYFCILLLEIGRILNLYVVGFVQNSSKYEILNMHPTESIGKKDIAVNTSVIVGDNLQLSMRHIHH